MIEALTLEKRVAGFYICKRENTVPQVVRALDTHHLPMSKEIANVATREGKTGRSR